jgi:hypothetical protein
MVSHLSGFNLVSVCSITNIFGNWLNSIDNRFKKHIRVEAIAFIWSLWLCRNDCLTIKTFLFCRLSTELLVHSVCDRLCSVHMIATFIRRYVHDWKLRRGILFPNMTGRIAYELVLLVRRFYNCSSWYVILPPYLEFCLDLGCVHRMQRPDVSLITIK